MSALQNQYWKCYPFFKEYKEKYLYNDIQAWQATNKCYLNLTAADLADIKSELKCMLLGDIKKKHQKNIEICHPRNYVLAVCKNDLLDILSKTANDRKKKSNFEYEWKVKMIDAKNRKNESLLTTLDKYSYEEVRELFVSKLNIREITVIYLVHCDIDYAKIAKILKISVDYCRKIYNQAENKLTEALGLA